MLQIFARAFWIWGGGALWKTIPLLIPDERTFNKYRFFTGILTIKNQNVIAPASLTKTGPTLNPLPNNLIRLKVHTPKTKSIIILDLLCLAT